VAIAYYRSVEEHIGRAVPDYHDDLTELKKFKSIDLSFQREKKFLAQAVNCPCEGLLWICC
jgi:hypothetical protein